MLINEPQNDKKRKITTNYQNVLPG